MRSKYDDVVEIGRMRTGKMRTAPGDQCGVFLLYSPGCSWLNVIAGNGDDWKEMGLPEPVWEHVSVSRENTLPSWQDMAWVKDLFWGDDEVVVHFHPAKTSYVNIHPNCLHLWKPVGVVLPMPPLECV